MVGLLGMTPEELEAGLEGGGPEGEVVETARVAQEFLLNYVGRIELELGQQLPLITCIGEYN